MRKLLLVLAGILLVITVSVSQKPVAIKALSLFQGKQPETYSLFDTAREAKEETEQYVERAYRFTIRPEVFQQLKDADPGLLRLTLPDPFDIQLDLYRTNVFDHGARILTSDGRAFSPSSDHQFYRGIIHGNSNSLAIVSVFRERIQIFYADQEGNKRITQTPEGYYILFADKDLTLPRDQSCFVEDLDEINTDEGDRDHSQERMVTGNCVQVYVECDYKSYQDNGSSVANTEEWVAELWNEVITLYENEDIPVSVSDIMVYTSPDPWAGLNSTSAVLTAFRSYIAGLTYNGRLAHLLSTRSLGGGIAYLDVLCSNSHQVAVSASLSTNIISFPAYSWTVEVVTHEMGHNMGSHHTHACAWNGNNTALDGCGPAAGYSEGCDAPVPPSGTIMSYCHLVSGVGINFNNGFGTQPGNRIRDKYNNASCNTGLCTPPPCPSLTAPTPNSTGVDINQNLFWSSASGADGYRLTIGTTPTNGSILNNIDVGLVTTYDPPGSFPFSTTIYVKIVPYNSIGNATGCTNYSFTTEANVAPACTPLTLPANGATGVLANAILYWNHSVGNQTGYKISIGLTPNGTEIANQVNVGNTTSYDHPVDFPYATTLYVKITPYWAGGDITGCASQSFTTVVPVVGDLCTTAISLPCGAAIQGNTSTALPDPGLPSCQTTVDAPGLWYTFVGDGQNVVISTCTQYGYDTKLNAYRGSCSNLICVAGNDDFCNTGSLLTFATTNGTTYFILVQGWEGQVGSFTLTRSCYTGPLYCASQGNNSSLEWIKTVTLGSFTKNSGASSYSSFLNDTITVSRGGTYAVQLVPQFAQTARSEYYRVWVDYNKDGDFADSGELVYSAGPTTSTTNGNITIPVTVATGNTRMRVAMRYNQAPSSCNAFAFGEVEDYTLKIKCNMVTSTSDSGNGSLRNVSACAANTEPILFSPTLNGQTINVTTGPITVTGDWHWMANPGTNIHIKAGNITRILSVPAGKSAEIQNLKLTGGTASVGSAIDNTGTLNLRDCDVHPAAGSTSSPIRNTGMINIFGVCDIRY